VIQNDKSQRFSDLIFKIADQFNDLPKLERKTLELFEADTGRPICHRIFA